MDDAVRRPSVPPSTDLNVEQPLVHRHRELLGGDIGRRAVDLDVAALLDPRGDQRDIASAQRVDLRAGNLDAAGVEAPAGEVAEKPSELVVKPLGTSRC